MPMQGRGRPSRQQEEAQPGQARAPVRLAILGTESEKSEGSSCL